MIDQDVSFDGYRVERILGRGGMGVVYEAVQTSLERRVALKILRPELAEDPGFVERLRREGRIQASIEHPHVLDVYEVGESPSNGLFLAMRLVEGPTLAELLRAGELSAERTLHLLEQVGGALDAAHAAGLLHRDVKAQNILVGEGDFAFLGDFGLSRAGTDEATSSRPMLGTVAYVAPEVIRGGSAGPASDRYSFAATLFHCLTGDVVFPRGSDAAVLFSHAGEPPPLASERRPELPATLDPLFVEALAKDPARRPASASALVAGVRDALGPAAVASLGPPDLSGHREATPPTVASPVSLPPTHAPAVQRRWRAAALLALAVVVATGLGAGAVALFKDGAGTDAPAEVPVPAIAGGAQPLGSVLGLPDRSLGCGGGEPIPGSRSCSIVQSGLPGAQLLAPSDGTIVGWSVRGASGELALDVIRPRGEDTLRVGRSQWESAGNAASYRYPTDLPVERGDVIGVELGPGAAIGTRSTDGATTNRWLAPTGGAYGAPDREPGSGFDRELMLRADFVPGGEVKAPIRLTGAAAARAPDGTVRQRAVVRISRPPSTVRVALVETGDRVALDLLRDGRRVERLFIPDLVPGGVPVDLDAITYEGGEFSEVDIWWVNPSSGRLIFHFFNVSRRQLQFEG